MSTTVDERLLPAWKVEQTRRRANGHHQPDDWRRGLLLTPTKNPKPIFANALTALRDAPEWNGVLAYNEFALVTCY